MLTLPTEEDKVGLIIKGDDAQQELAFAICLGINLKNSSLEISTITAAPDPKDIQISDPNINPEKVRTEIIDHKRNMIENKKGFYVEEIENRVLSILESITSELKTRFRDETVESIEEFLLEEIGSRSTFSSELQFMVYPVKYEELELDNSGDDNQPKPDSSTEAQVLQVSPLIDAKNGKPIEDLRRGVDVLVRLTGESAELMGFEVDDEEDQKPNPLPATILDYQKIPGKSEGLLSVKLQKGIRGRCEIPIGTKIKLKKDSVEDDTDEYVQGIEISIAVVAFLLILVLLYTILIVLI